MAYPTLLYEQILTSGTLTASSEMSLSGNVKENAVDWKPFVTAWQPSGMIGPHWLAVDLASGLQAQPDSVCFIDHNLRTVSSGTAYHVVQYSDNGTNWTNAYTPVQIADDRLHYKEFTLGAGHRYYRFQISGTFYDFPYLGEVCVGRRLVFPEGLQEGFDPNAETVRQTNPVSEFGVFLAADVRRIDKSYSLSWDGNPGIAESFFDDTTYPVLSMIAFWKKYAGRRAQPFFFGWDTDKKDPELCRIKPESRFGTAFGATYLRRALNLTFEVFVELGS